MSIQSDVEADLPPTQRATVIIPSSRVATLFSSPFELVSGTTGKILIATHIHIRKQAGVAWTTTGSGRLRVSATGTGALHFWQFNQAVTTAFFGAAEAVWVGEAGYGDFASFGFVAEADAVTGKGISLSLQTADISAGTGSLICHVWYRAWPGV